MTVLADPAPLDERTVLSPVWLSSVLQVRDPAVSVSGTTVTERLQTVATKIRFRLQGVDDHAEVPGALCAKGYFDPAMHRRLAGGQTETIFYRDLAASLQVRTPPCVYAAIDEATGHGLILMDDLVEAGATFLDPLVTYGPDQVAATLDQLAALHAAFWERGDAESLSAFPPRLESLAGVLDAETLQSQLDDGRGADLPDDVRRADRLRNAMLALSKLGHDVPRCLVHGDVHTGNVYELADGSPGIIDWQVAQRGVWALDVAYHVAAVLDPDERARSERQLLDHHLDRLAAHGAEPPDLDEAWRLYRAHLAYGFYMWSITRLVDRPIIEQLTRRLGLAAAQHRSFDILGV